MFDNARLQMQNYPARNSSSQSSRAWLERQSKDPYVQKAQELGLPSRAYFKLQEINEQHYSASVNKKSKKNKSTSSSNRRMIQPNMLVLDLGAAPGGWSLYVSTEIDPTLGGGIVAVDLLPLNLDISTRIEDNVGGRFEFVQGDFTQNKIRLEVMDRFARLSKETQSTEDGQRDLSTQRKANLIVSDMAANFLGDSKTDAIRTINLCEQALSFAAGDGCFDSSYSPKEDQGMLLKDGSFLCKYFSCGKDNEQELMDAAKRVFKSVHSFKPKASRKESSEMYLLGYSKL
jgi:23S rRNA (uridine2552-2'-O)-methyltransferase